MKKFLLMMIIPSVLVLSSCGGDKTEPESSSADQAVTDNVPEVQVDDNIEFGYGPIRDLQIADIDAGMVTKGDEIFKTKCMSCHRLEKRFTAPKLGDILKRRTPEFVMNMMLNPAENIEKHPIVQDLLKEYNIPMIPMGLTEEDARDVLEYIRDFPENK